MVQVGGETQHLLLFKKIRDEIGRKHNVAEGDLEILPSPYDLTWELLEAAAEEKATALANATDRFFGCQSIEAIDEMDCWKRAIEVEKRAIGLSFMNPDWRECYSRELDLILSRRNELYLQIRRERCENMKEQNCWGSECELLSENSDI